MENAKHCFGAKGHLSDEGVALFVDALKLDTVAQLPRALRDHVAGCDRCMTNVTELFALLRREDYSSIVQHPSFHLRDRRRVSPFVWRAAAAVAAVLTATAVVYMLVFRGAGERQQEPTHAAAVRPVDSAAAPAVAVAGTDSSVRPAMAANFTPNPEYEELVNAGIRSSSLSGVRPQPGAMLRAQEVRFAWDPGAGAHLTLVIINAKGDDVYRAVVTRLPHTPAKRLPSGLYYWKVLNREEALYFGKFIVKDDAHRPINTNPAQK